MLLDFKWIFASGLLLRVWSAGLVAGNSGAWPACPCCPFNMWHKGWECGPVTRETRLKMLLVTFWSVLEPEGLSDSQVLWTIWLKMILIWVYSHQFKASEEKIHDLKVFIWVFICRTRGQTRCLEPVSWGIGKQSWSMPERCHMSTTTYTWLSDLPF